MVALESGTKGSDQSIPIFLAIFGTLAGITGPPILHGQTIILPIVLHSCRKAYLQKAAEHHPDKGGDPEAFYLIQQAYLHYRGDSVASANGSGLGGGGGQGGVADACGGGAHGGLGGDMHQEEYWCWQYSIAEEAYSRARHGAAEGKHLPHSVHLPQSSEHALEENGAVIAEGLTRTMQKIAYLSCGKITRHHKQPGGGGEQ